MLIKILNIDNKKKSYTLKVIYDAKDYKDKHCTFF